MVLPRLKVWSQLSIWWKKVMRGGCHTLSSFQPSHRDTKTPIHVEFVILPWEGDRGAATIRATQRIINASYNQCERFFLSWTTDVVITVEKVRAPNAGRLSEAPHMYWPHIWWLIQAVYRGVDCNERWLYAALIICCVDYMLRWLYAALIICCVDYMLRWL
jgi:hypothetical protein